MTNSDANDSTSTSKGSIFGEYESLKKELIMRLNSLKPSGELCEASIEIVNFYETLIGSNKQCPNHSINNLNI